MEANEEALIRALPKGPDKLLRMIDFVKKTYNNYAIPDEAIEWFARDRCDMALSEQEIKERLDKIQEEEDKYLAKEYSQDELSDDPQTTGETDGPSQLRETEEQGL